MTIIRLRRFTIGHLTQTPLKYIFSESLRNVDNESILIKMTKKKLNGFPNIALYFPKYTGSLIKFVSDRV